MAALEKSLEIGEDFLLYCIRLTKHLAVSCANGRQARQRAMAALHGRLKETGSLSFCNWLPSTNGHAGRLSSIMLTESLLTGGHSLPVGRF